MSVLTANAFQLLDEENEDPEAILEATKVIAAKAEEKKKAISKEKLTAAVKPGSGAGWTSTVLCFPSSSRAELPSERSLLLPAKAEGEATITSF